MPGTGVLGHVGERLLGDPVERGFDFGAEPIGFETGHRLFGRRVQPRDRPDAVFCGNDQIARGLIDALALIGFSVPGDVAVVGFDNWEVFASATRPPLTTVDMGLSELGGLAGHTLLDLVDGKRILPGVRREPCRLVVRQSCGAGMA